MKVSKILKLSLKQINDVDLSNEIEGVYIGDLLSFVMANGKTGALWLTVNDFAGIIFVQNSYPDQDTIAKATELKIPLFISEDDAYHVAKELVNLGL